MTKKERMFALIDEWKQSGVSKTEFCHRKNLKVNTFAYWVNKVKPAEDERKTGFARIQIRDCSSTAQLLLIYPNGVKMEVDAKDLSLIKHLIDLA